MRLRNPIFWVVAITGLVLDQLTKLWVMNNFEYIPEGLGDPDTWPIWPGVFHFTYVTNPGAAFSMFSENNEWLPWLSLLVSLALIFMGLKVLLANRWEQAGYGFLLSGALGNGIDRFIRFNSEVVDFLDLQFLDIPIPTFSGGSLDIRWANFPIFNLADVCINIGIVCLIIVFFKAEANGNGNGGGNGGGGGGGGKRIRS